MKTEKRPPLKQSVKSKTIKQINLSMMKKLLTFVAISILATSTYSQVGIGDNPTDIHPSEALKISSTNKGIILPNVHLTSYDSADPIPNPAEGLLIYNKNPNLGKGFTMWKGSKWKPMLNSSNIAQFLGVINSSTVISTTAVDDKTKQGATLYTEDEGPSTNRTWKQIPGVEKTIQVNSQNNTVSVNVNGIVQVKQSNSTNTSTTSYAIGIFVNGKLKSVRNFILKGDTDCNYGDFNILYTAKDLDPSVNHKIKVYEIYRTNVDDTNYTPTLTFGGKNSLCSNLSDNMARTVMNIQITETPQ